MTSSSAGSEPGHADGSLRPPRLAVTLGDPRGIGPEITRRALENPLPFGAEVVLIGPADLPDLTEHEVMSIGAWTPDLDAAEAGRLSYLAIERSVSLIHSGRVDAIVTAPISKAALASAGYSWPGHTEMLRDLAGVSQTALCLTAESLPAGGALRVVLVTGHLALRQVAANFTAERLYDTARLAHDGLRRWWGLERPRLSACALNPHASDDGLFGDEEARIYGPTLERLRQEGLDIEGPFPADTVFLRAMEGAADAVLAPYHDVGMTAIKTAAFGRAVNVTLGLPFPRTSPDHGTAFDIAGLGRADPSSMRAALEAAARFANRALTFGSESNRLAVR